MIDKKKIAQYNAEMVEYADEAAQYLGALIGDRLLTKELNCDMVDYVLAQTKRNIESSPFASQEEKDAKIRHKEYLMKYRNHKWDYNG